MYPYAISSVFAFICMIIGVLFGQLFGSKEPPSEQVFEDALTEEEQEIFETIVDDLKED